jgi:hypothetical protein
VGGRASKWKRLRKPLLHRGAPASRWPCPASCRTPHPVGRCGPAAPTHRRRRSSRQDARAPLKKCFFMDLSSPTDLSE